MENSIEAATHGGLGTFQFKKIGGQTIKFNNTKYAGANIAGKHKFKKIQNYGNLGIKLGIDISKTYVDDFTYENKKFKSNEVDNHYSIFIGLSFDF